MMMRETLVCIKRPRCDTNGGSETEVTVTSKQHAQRDRGDKPIPYFDFDFVLAGRRVEDAMGGKGRALPLSDELAARPLCLGDPGFSS